MNDPMATFDWSGSQPASGHAQRCSLVSFSNAQAALFRRAFKKWSGLAPGEYRQSRGSLGSTRTATSRTRGADQRGVDSGAAGSGWPPGPAAKVVIPQDGWYPTPGLL